MLSGLLAETILSLEEIASHHSIEAVWVEDIRVERIRRRIVNLAVSGHVDVELR